MKLIFTKEEHHKFESLEDYRNDIYTQCIENFNKGINVISFYVDNAKKPFREDIYEISPEIINFKMKCMN